MEMVEIDASKMPKGDIEYLARSVLADIGNYFEDPKVQEDYAKWLEERKEVAV